MRPLKKLHGRLNETNGAYGAWHKQPFNNHVHWATLALTLLVLTPAIFLSYKQLRAMPEILAFETKNAFGEVMSGQVLFLDEDSNEVLGEGLSVNLTASVVASVSGKKYKIKFTPTNGLVTSLEYDEVELYKKPKGNQTDNIDLGNDVEIALDEPPTPLGWDKVLAIGDVKGFSFSKGRYKKIAQGRDLFKCLEWDFANQKCNGRWVKRADLIPGAEYTVEFAPGDPGYAESSKKVNALNKKNELLDYIENSTPDAVTVTLVPDISLVSTTLPVQEITISQIDTTNPNNDLIIDVVNITNDSVVQEAVIVDTTNLAAAETTITNVAKSNVLVGCVNYQESDNTCNRWKKEKNIVLNEDYIISISSPGKSVFGQSRDGLLVLDKNLEVLPQALQTLDVDKVAVQFANMNPYKITTYSDVVNAGTTEEIIVDGFNQGSENANGKTMSFDLSSSTVNSADIDATAVGYDLFHCSDFDLENQICKGKYKKSKDLRRDENYSFSIAKQDGVSEFFESKKRIALLDKENNLFSYTETSVSTETGTDIEITPTEINIIKKIKLKNHIENTGNDLKINEDVQSPREDALQSYAVDPTGLGTNSELEIEAKGNSLYKCKDWDFTNSTCLGTWEKIKTLKPGAIYTLAIDQADPGFMETNDSSLPPSAPEPTPTPTPEPTPTPTSNPEPEQSSVQSPSTTTTAKTSSSGRRRSSSYASPSVAYNQLPDTSASRIPAETPNTILNKNIMVIVPGVTVFKRNLYFGSVGQDIKSLQEFLNKNGFIVASFGPGSPGRETNYFGPLTTQALKKFQQTYAEKILKPAGLQKATGIFGPYTKKYINSF